MALSVFSGDAFASSSRNLTIFAEPNMVASLTKIARIYSQKNNVVVSINFNSSSELMADVDSGEPADVFISAHPGWIETLKQKGLVDVYNIGYIARDKMVLITPKDNKNIPPEFSSEKKVSLEEALQILNNYKATLITDQDGNSSGKYSNDLIKSLTLNDLKLSAKLSEDKSPVLSLIKEAPEHYGLLLTSQINKKEDWQIIATAKESHIFYQALVIAGDNMETAREFLKFLKSEAAKTTLRENNFIIE